MGDAFESKYMADDGAVRHRDKRVSRLMAGVLAAPALFIWTITAIVALTNSTADKPVPAAALPIVVAALIAFGALFGLLSLTFSVLRTVVTNDSVIVKYGLFGPEIPLDAIRSCKVSRYKARHFGGWGIRRGLGGAWAYVPGPGDVVELEYEQDGETRKVLIGANDAHELARQIERARQARGGKRIDVTHDPAVEEEMAAIEHELEDAQARAER